MFVLLCSVIVCAVAASTTVTGAICFGSTLTELITLLTSGFLAQYSMYDFGNKLGKTFIISGSAV